LQLRAARSVVYLAAFAEAMTNPTQAIRMLITYAVVVPLAALVGWLLCNPLDYGTLGFFAFIAVLLASPIFIKWHYPILLFGLGLPAVCFFLPGRPPLWQAVSIISLGLAIVDRTLNSDKKFISAPVMTWPLLFTVAMAYFTAELTGGIGLHSLGGDVGGGKKYISVFVGAATYFALTSRRIPKEQRGRYIALIFLAASPAFISDLFQVLPAPLNYINLFIPPSQEAAARAENGITAMADTRFGALGTSAGVVVSFLLARYGLRGIVTGAPWRLPLLLLMLVLSLMGGFRIVLIGLGMQFTLLFFLEGLHRTRLLLVFVMGVFLAVAIVVPFSSKMPIPIQRAISFLPVKVDAEVAMDAEGSKLWREQMWRDVWPKVPQYLLLGKGYALHAEDFEYMGNGTFANSGADMDAGGQGLAVSMDYHNGPLSTLMPFGVWGMISFLWVAGACLFVTYRNYRYGDEELRTVNRYWFMTTLIHIFNYFFIFGAYSDDIGQFAKVAGFSVAFNWGVCRAKPVAVATPTIRRLPKSAITAPA
jgi:O-Antigen ligase